MTSQPACAAGGLAEVQAVFPAKNHTLTTGKGGRRLFEGAPCVPFVSTVAADVHNLSTSRLLLDDVYQQHPRLTRQQWLPSQGQVDLHVQRQLRYEPMPHRQRVLSSRHETFSGGEPAPCGSRQPEHPHSQQELHNESQDEFSRYRHPPVQQVHPGNRPTGNALMRHPAAGVAPSFASVSKAISSFVQRTAPEVAEGAGMCPFDRLRELGSTLGPDVPLASRLAAAHPGVYAPAQSRLSTAAELSQDKAVSKGQRDDTLCSVSPAAPPESTPEEAAPHPSVSSPVTVTGKTTACPPTVRQGKEPAVEAEDREAVAVYRKDAFALPASIASAVHGCRAAGDDTKLLASYRRRDSQTVDRNTGALYAWQPSVYGRIMHNATPLSESDAADALLPSFGVPAVIGPGEITGASVRACTASAACASRCGSTYGSALCISPSQATANVSKRLYTGGAPLGRESSVAKAPHTPAEEKCMCAAADGGEVKSAYICEGCENECTRSKEVVSSGKVSHGLICPVEHADPEKPEKVRANVSNQVTQGSKGEQQQVGQECTNYERHLNIIEVPDETEQSSQQLEKGVPIQQMSIEEDVRILAHGRYRARDAFEGRTGAVQLPTNHCYGLQGVHTIPLITTSASKIGTRESRGSLHGEARKQKGQPCGNADRLEAVEQQPAKRGFSIVGEYASSAPRTGNVAEAGVEASPCWASGTADMSVTWQPALAPPARISSCATTTAPPTAACDTTGSSSRWIDAGEAPRGEANSAAAPHNACAASRPFTATQPVSSWPLTASGLLYPSESFLPSFTSHAVVSQIHLNSQRRCVAPSAGASAPGILTCATTDRRVFSSVGFPSRLRRLPLGESEEKLYCRNAQTFALPTISPATTAEYMLGQTLTSGNSPTCNASVSYTSVPRVLPCNESRPSPSPRSGETTPHGASESANQFHEDAVADGSRFVQVVGEAAATNNHPAGFPSYPACVTENDFRQHLLSSKALHHTDPANRGTICTAPVALYRRTEPQEVCVRASRSVSRPVATVHQQVSLTFHSARRRCVGGPTEEQGRRQLRLVSSTLGAIWILGVFSRVIGVVFYRTTSPAVSVEQFDIARSHDEHISLRPILNMPVMTRANSVAAPPESSWQSVFNMLARMSWAESFKKAQAASEGSDAVACARPAPTSGERRNGSSVSSSIAQFVMRVLVRLSARRRRSLDAWLNNADDLRGNSAATANSEKQQHDRHKQENEFYRGGDIFARTRWRRRESHGSSPIVTLLLYITFFFRNLVLAVTAALHILIGYFVTYILRSLMLLMLRISASFACTAFMFVFAARLMLERINALRHACTAASSAVVGLPFRSIHSNTGRGTVDRSNSEQYPSNDVPASQQLTDGGGDSSEAHGSGTFDVSATFHNSLGLAPRVSRMEMPHEVECNTITLNSHQLTHSVPANKILVPPIGSWISLAALKSQGFTKLGRLSDAVFKHGLHASITVASLCLPFVKVAASAVVSFVTAAGDLSDQPADVFEHQIQQKSAGSFENTAQVLRPSESEITLQRQHAQSLLSI